MSEEYLRGFFADVQMILNVKLGKFCDRNGIYRSDFSNFMNKKKYFCSLYELDQMKEDILDHVHGLLQIYEKVA